MAEVTVQIKIDNAEAANSLREMQKALKALISEQNNVARGTKEWEKLAKAINETESKIGDLQDSFQTLKGSGVERLDSSFRLLTEGFGKADFEKVKIGFKGIGAAMSAVPAFLLVEGFKALIDNWDKVVAFAKVVIGSFDEQQKAIKRLSLEVEKQKEVTAQLTKESEREIAIMEASGASHEKIVAAKKRLIEQQIQEAIVTAKLNIAKIQEVQNNDNLEESYYRVTAAALRRIGADEKAEQIDKLIAASKAERNKENVKAVQDSLNLIKDLQTKAQVEDIKLNNENAANFKKTQEQKLKDYLDLEKQLSDAKIAGAQIDKENRALIQADIDAENKAKAAAAKAALDETLRQEQEAYDKSVEAKKKADEEKKQSDAAVQQAVVTGINAAQSLADTVGELAIRRAQGNAQKEIAIRKQMFNIDKAFNVARAIQDGIRSVQAALTIPPPGGQILAGINAAAAAANVAKILATKFDGGNISVGGANGSVPNLPGGGSQPVNNQQLPQVRPQESTQFDNQGNKVDGSGRVVVLQSDIKLAMDSVAKVKQQSKF